MNEAARLRAQKPYSTDPEYLERMAVREEARDDTPAPNSDRPAIASSAEPLTDGD